MNKVCGLHVGALAVCLTGAALGGELGSITFTGGQYVNTGVVPRQDMRVVCDFQLLEKPALGSYAAPFASLGTTAGGLNVGWGLRAHGPQVAAPLGGRWAAWAGNDYVYITNNDLDLARHTIELKDQLVTFDATEYATGPARDPSSVALTGIYVGNQGSPMGPVAPAKMRLFSLKIYRPAGGTETLAYDFVPYELDGVLGLYDRQNARFIGRQGSAALLPGAWTDLPTVTPSTWNRRGGAAPTISTGTAASGVSVTCSHTAQQLAALPTGSHLVTFTASSSDAAFDGQTAQVVFTVEDALRARVTDDARTVHLTFPPADGSRTLYLAYGKTDGGSDPSGWDHVETQPVAAGADSAEVTAPVGFGAENPVWSVFLRAPATAKTALSYARQDAMIAQWDGLDNKAYGHHDGSLKCPVELRHGLALTMGGVGAKQLTSSGKSFAIGTAMDYFTFHSPNLRDAINAGRATVEIVMAKSGGYCNNGGVFCFGQATRGFWAYQKDNDAGKKILGDVSYHGRSSGDYDSYAEPAGLTTNTFTFVLATTTGSSSYAVDGVRQPRTGGSAGGVGAATLTRFSTDLTDDVGYVGAYPAITGSRANAQVQSIRVYDCVLTEAEQARNLEIDRVRFRGGDLEKAGPFYADIPLQVASVNMQQSVPVSADLSFSGSDAVRKLYFAWGPQDGGPATGAWAQCEFACNVPAGVTTLTAEIPAAARSAIRQEGGFRFFLDDVVSAKSYVKSGNLIAQWDGEENAGFGRHDAAASCPVELRQNLLLTTTGALACDAKSFAIGVNYFTFNSVEFQAAVNAGHATVELVLAKNGGYANNAGVFCFGSQTRGFWVYQKSAPSNTNRIIGDMTYHGRYSGDYDTYAEPAGLTTNTFTFVLGSSTETSCYAFDGVKQVRTGSSSAAGATEGLTRFTTDVEEDIGYVGAYPANLNWRANAKVLSIRLYDCALDADDLSKNLSIDARRFRGAAARHEVTDYTQVLRRGTVLIFR